MRSIFRIYDRQEWQIAAAMFIAYVAVRVLVNRFLPIASGLHPGVAIALVALFFGGLRLWPVAFLSSFTATLLLQTSPIGILIIPISVTLQAVLGAYLLRAARIDPIFRRYRDMAYLFATIIVISTISPTADAIAAAFRGMPFSLQTWGHFYVATVFSLVLLTPFLLRWITKPRFARTASGWVELFLVFALLIGLNSTYFFFGLTSFIGIPILYILLIPLFWISLRMRPRFVTLSLLMTGSFALAKIIISTPTDMLVNQLFSVEIMLIVLAAIFLTITSIEEDRRVNTNILQSQMLSLENAITRVTSESQAKNEFIAILAHELRNPLAPVVSAIDLLKIKGPHDEEDAETLDMMADRMSVVRRLLDDLLDISRISEGKIVLNEETVNLESVIQRSILSTNHHRKEAHQNLIFKSSDKPLFIEGDPTRLEQVFSNILTNASKYSNQGDTVTITMRERAGFAEVEIRDEGIGLSKHEIERIFLPFQQVQNAERSAHGLGIGLSLVRSFVEMHGGMILAESEGTDKGSRFIVRLPLVPSTNETVARRTRLWRRAEPSMLKKAAQLSIVIADDNDAAAAGIGRVLERQGCEISYAYDGKQALELIMREKPDIAILDIGLPGYDGYTVAKMLRTRGYDGRLIALTGYSTAEAVEKSMDAGFDSFVVKPARLADLRRALPELA